MDSINALIEKRAESLDIHQLDRDYYAALKQVMEVSDIPSGKSQSFSWMYELEWRSHKVTRQGYLVFGLPDKTTSAFSTADEGFLLYFLPPYQCSVISHQLPVISSKKEVFFRLTKTDEIFNRILRLYSAAIDSAFEVTYQGRTQLLLDWLAEVKKNDFRVTQDPALFNPHPLLLANFRDLIDLVADVCLEQYFSELAPEYPIFSILISYENLAQTAQEALRGIANQKRSQQAQEILAALNLLEELGRC